MIFLKITTPVRLFALSLFLMGLISSTPTVGATDLCRVYLIPLGHYSQPDPASLVEYYRQTLGLIMEVLPAIPLDSSVVDQGRNQLIGEELIRVMKERYPSQSADERALLIGLTQMDMFIRFMPWQFAFTIRMPDHFVVTSTARMDPLFFNEPDDPNKVTKRVQKSISRTLGVFYYRLPLQTRPTSLMYGQILSVSDLDRLAPDFDAADRELIARKPATC